MSAQSIIKAAGQSNKNAWTGGIQICCPYCLNNIRVLLSKANLDIEDIAYIVPHQANQKLLTGSKTVKIPIDKFFMNLDRYGNTSATSIGILTFSWQYAQQGDKVILVGFGGGMTMDNLLEGPDILMWF